tara:strand:- start:10709 stop:11737 length:1029 start_codon:yes stop_codon:yes gene_type:complete
LKKIIIRVDASNEIGYGHLIRCITICEHFLKNFFDCTIVLKNYDSDCIKIVSHYNTIKFKLIKEEEDILLLSSILEKKTIILDLNNEFSFKSKRSYKSYISFLKKNNFFTISFEDFYVKNSISNITIIPYVGAKEIFKNKILKSNYLFGGRYFIFRDEFIDSAKVRIKKKIENLFICMGGSDPDYLTEKFLKFLNSSKYKPNLKIILKNIDTNRKNKIKNILKDYNRYELIINPKNISEIMLSSDLGIVNSGLIKYETAFLGLPCLSVSNDLKHEKIMNFFVKKSNCLHLGISKQISRKKFNIQFDKIIEDYSLRKLLSKRGKDLFDGKGKERLFNVVSKLI